MSSIIYAKVTGEKQGLISAGCSTMESIGNKYQLGHEDQIFTHALSNLISRDQHVNFHPVEIRKPIDKSTPLIANAISNNEKMTWELYFYRTSQNGGLELYFKMKLINATLTEVQMCFQHSITQNEYQPEELLSLKYESVTWEHVPGGTSSYSIWDDRVY